MVTSIDNYQSYCLVVDQRSRYVWIFLTKSKKPPIDQLAGLLGQLKAKLTSTYCTITTDNGGELAKAASFQNMINDSGYVLKTTGRESSAQNGLAEKPNLDLARMMHVMLYASGKGSEYWSYALRHAVYLKNRLPHQSLKYVSPYEVMNSKKPDLSQLRVFGARVHYKNKQKGMKLDRLDGTGAFMTFKGTNKICYVIDSVTKKECVVTHAIFDEAFMSVPRSSQPPMATALQQAGFTPTKEKRQLKLKVTSMESDIKLPKKATLGAAGFDIYSGEKVVIAPGSQAKISTKLKLEIPDGYYGQILVRSGFASKYCARVEAGCIDNDYRGEVFVLMSNNGDRDICIDKNDRFAQLVLHKTPSVIVEPKAVLSSTIRNEGGFGSTGVNAIV